MASSTVPRVKPPALQPGDTVGIVAPASNIKRELVEKGSEALRQLGYKPFYFESILEQEIYFAGSAERRARELGEMFARDEVRGILCARGGYGANYLLENQSATVATHEGVPLYVELPASVELIVQHTDPGLQGDRSTGGTKPATLETGAEIQVPLFVTTGEKVKVDTRDGRYLGRVSS